MARREKIHQSLCETLIPEHPGPEHHGEIWVARDKQSFWYVNAQGQTICLSDVLNSLPVHTPPRHGCDGAPGPKGDKGDSIVGPAGRDGLPGAAGRNGIDGSVGPQGRPGGEGKDSIACEERVANIETAIRELRAERAAFVKEVAALKADLAGIIDRDKLTGQYMAWLRA